MEIKQLRYFLAVADVGSFSKAAVLLSVAQPVLSRQIRSLEEELGAELFYRNGRGIVVSEAGETLVTHARLIVTTAQAIRTDIEAMQDDPRGRLIIAMPPTAATILSVPLIERFRENYPRIKLNIQECYSGHALEWLSTGRVDVAVLYDAPKTSTLTTEPLIEEELLLVGPYDEAEAAEKMVAASELAELPLILPSHPHGLRMLVENRLGALKIHPDVPFEIDSLGGCIELVIRRCGYTILPYAAIAARVDAGELTGRLIVSPRITRQLVLATSTQRPTTSATRALARAVTQLARDLVRDGVWRSCGVDPPAPEPEMVAPDDREYGI